MRKETSTIIALAIATILTAYILALTLSNQAFAQELVPGDNHQNQFGLLNQLGPPAGNNHGLLSGSGGGGALSISAVVASDTSALIFDILRDSQSITNGPQMIVLGGVLASSGQGQLPHLPLPIGLTFGAQLTNGGLVGANLGTTHSGGTGSGSTLGSTAGGGSGGTTLINGQNGSGASSFDGGIGAAGGGGFP